MPRRISHNGLVEFRIKESDPRQTYAGLLWIAKTKGYSRGWVAHKFREIFGGWPRPKSKVAPVQPDMQLVEWIGITNTRYRAKKKREEAKVQALKDNDMLPSFMTPEDWDVRL